jgi:large subunit ribosomal protein L25
MKSVPLTAFPRTLTRRVGSNKLRSTGRVPAVIYGKQLAQSQSLEIVSRDMETLIHHSASENLLVDLTVDGDAKPLRLVLVQEVQHHPLSGKILHVDFHEVAENEKVTIQVPVETKGEAAGVKTGGGVLEHVLFKLRIRALPRDIPETIVIDVSSLEIGKAIHIGDIVPPAGVEILGDKKISVVAVAAPTAEEVAPAAGDAPAASAVEMTKEKKDDTAAKGDAKAGGKGDDKKADEKKPAEKKK